MHESKHIVFPNPESTFKGVFSHGDSTVALSVFVMTAITATLINKWLTTSSEYKFPFPYFVSFFQLCFSLVMLALWQTPGTLRLLRMRTSRLWNADIAHHLLFLAFLHVSTLALSPYFFQYVQAIDYTLVRSLSLPLSLLFSFLCGNRTNGYVQKICAVCVIGSVVSAFGNLHLSWEGFFYGSLWAAVLALYSLEIKKTLPVVNNNTCSCTI
ncbi:hypothetical protein BDF14DRAFT_715807 [Spinellus fusiger]|nr:hypothetical protein BDF14DRAFT_715807 [Spinellus fusiger]